MLQGVKAVHHALLKRSRQSHDLLVEREPTCGKTRHRYHRMNLLIGSSIEHVIGVTYSVMCISVECSGKSRATAEVVLRDRFAPMCKPSLRSQRN